jgi:hypothetical protein
MNVGSTAGVISGSLPGAKKICRQPMFLMELRTLLLLLLLPYILRFFVVFPVSPDKMPEECLERGFLVNAEMVR